MGFLSRLLMRLFGPKFERTDSSMPISMVLLLRQPHAFNEAELTEAAKRAWSTTFDRSENSKSFVIEKGSVTILKVGNLVLHFPAQGRPYLDDPEEVASGFARENLQDAWLQHRAWVSIDCLKLRRRRTGILRDSQVSHRIDRQQLRRDLDSSGADVSRE